MTKGKHMLGNLSEQEYQAALAAIKLVRGEEIKNAYLEGHDDGYRTAARRYKGEYTKDISTSWEMSHAKALLDGKQ